MDIEDAFVSHLLADAGVVALVGNRVIPLVAEEDTALPYVVYQRISTPRSHTHGGPDALARPRFQFSCVAATYTEARQVANAVRVALNGFKGLMGSAPGVQVEYLRVDNEIEDYEFESTRRRSLVDAIIWHRE